MKHTTVGVDIAKSVIQLHWVEPDTGEIVSRQIKRATFLEHFANRAPCVIGMEACGGAQHWARQLIGMGHQLKLMPGKFVKAFSFATLTFNVVVGLLESIRRLEGDYSPRHDESRAQRTSERRRLHIRANSCFGFFVGPLCRSRHQLSAVAKPVG
jgi:transposase